MALSKGSVAIGGNRIPPEVQDGCCPLMGEHGELGKRFRDRISGAFYQVFGTINHAMREERPYFSSC